MKSRLRAAAPVTCPCSRALAQPGSAAPPRRGRVFAHCPRYHAGSGGFCYRSGYSTQGVPSPSTACSDTRPAPLTPSFRKAGTRGPVAVHCPSALLHHVATYFGPHRPETPPCSAWLDHPTGRNFGPVLVGRPTAGSYRVMSNCRVSDLPLTIRRYPYRSGARFWLRSGNAEVVYLVWTEQGGIFPSS